MTNYSYPTDVHTVTDTFQDHVNRGSVNPGTDYAVAMHSPVHSVAAGIVTDADSTYNGSGGRVVHVDHDDGSGVDYLHLSLISVNVGERVSQGSLIGLSGASGYGSDNYYGPHLHISFRYNHSHGYSNVGNVDFDALMKSQTTVQGVSAPLPPVNREEYEMKYQAVTSSLDGRIGAGYIYVQSANGPLRAVDNSEGSAIIESGEFIARWNGDDIRSLITRVGILEYAEMLPGLKMSNGTPLMGPGQLTGKIIYANDQLPTYPPVSVVNV
jgi:murein DD-endopeptidase MepM/ murein hydrolase activator NlpD